MDAGRLRDLVAALRTHADTPKVPVCIPVHRRQPPPDAGPGTADSRGLCVSSGVVEAGCKQIGARLKRAGMRWTVAAANAILALALLHPQRPLRGLLGATSREGRPTRSNNDVVHLRPTDRLNSARGILVIVQQGTWAQKQLDRLPETQAWAAYGTTKRDASRPGNWSAPHAHSIAPPSRMTISSLNCPERRPTTLTTEMSAMRAVRPTVLAVVALGVLPVAPIVLAAGRVALMVGNSTGAYLGRLPTTQNDAADTIGCAAAAQLRADDRNWTQTAVGLTEAFRRFTRQRAGALRRGGGCFPGTLRRSWHQRWSLSRHA